MGKKSTANITASDALTSDVGRQPSGTFLTFPQNPQWLLSDGREFHAGPCGSIRICRGNPHWGLGACSQRHLELISSPSKGGLWIICCWFASMLGFISQWCFTKVQSNHFPYLRYVHHLYLKLQSVLFLVCALDHCGKCVISKILE